MKYFNFVIETYANFTHRSGYVKKHSIDISILLWGRVQYLNTPPPTFT